MASKKAKKRLMISATVVSAALGAAAPSAEASVQPTLCGSPPPFTDPTFFVQPNLCGSPPPFTDPKFFPRGGPDPTICNRPPPFTPGFFPHDPEPNPCGKPPPGIEPV
jgi:hypothetical protein